MKTLFYALFSLSCISSIGYAMENPRQIVVDTLTKKNLMTIDVNDETTILDIKHALRDSEGIPPRIQRIHAMIPNLLIGYKPSELLADDANVAFVMETYRAEKFIVALSLRPDQQ